MKGSSGYFSSARKPPKKNQTLVTSHDDKFSWTVHTKEQENLKYYVLRGEFVNRAIKMMAFICHTSI